MPLDLQQTRLYARQIALPAVGSQGQQRLLAATVVVFRTQGAEAGPGDPAVTAAAYLRAAGVGTVNLVPVPGAAAGWQAALTAVQVALRFALDDDDLLPLASAAGVPLVVGRVLDDTVDLLAFRHHGGCAHQRMRGSAGRPAGTAAPGAAATVLATLAATECLWMLIDPERQPAARRLRLPLGGGAPACDAIPWPPLCPLCAAATPGGAAKTSFS